jgi:hypothetical protein
MVDIFCFGSTYVGFSYTGTKDKFEAGGRESPSKQY